MPHSVNTSALIPALLIAASSLLLAGCWQQQRIDGESGTGTGTGTANNIRTQSSNTSAASDLGNTYLNLPRLSRSAVLESYLPGTNGRHVESSQYVEAAGRANERCDYASGMLLSTEAIKLSQSNPLAFYERARALLYCPGADDERAIDDLKKTIALINSSDKPNPDLSSRASIMLAGFYDSKKRPADAISAIDKAIIQSPHNKALYKARAALLVAQGKAQKAKKDYDAWIRLAPADTLPRFLRGQLLESMNEYEQALQDYDFATRLPDSKGSISKRGVSFKAKALLLSRLNRHKEAIVVLNTAIAQEKYDDELLLLRAKEYATLKSYGKAIEDYSFAIDMAPGFAAEALEGRSQVFAIMGKPVLASKDRLEARQLREAPAEKQLFELKH